MRSVIHPNLKLFVRPNPSKMTSRKLISTAYNQQIPQSVLMSLNLSQTSLLSHLSPPFWPKPPSVLATNVIKSYLEKGQVKEARILFDETPDKDVYTWTAMISGYTSCSYHMYAWTAFCEMRRASDYVGPNEYTFSSVLKACKGIKSHTCGSLVHSLVLRYGMHGFIYVDNVLLDVYATCCKSMDEAWLLFQEIGAKNSVSWTTLIAGYTHQGDAYGALSLFKQMFVEEAELSSFTLSIATRACTLTGSNMHGQQVHAAVVKRGFSYDIPVMNSLIDMYFACSNVSEANQCFQEMPEKDLITWNTLIAGYEKPYPDKCLNVYSQMVYEGVGPNCFTYTSILAAVANLAILRCGEQVHGGIVKTSHSRNLELTNALIDMYAKCGQIMDSRKVFDEMSSKDLVSWTSMMIGYGSHGFGKKAVELFDEMVKSGIIPDRIVFVAILNACSHAGLVDEGLRYFRLLSKDYNIAPTQEIYGCVVDLLGRAGRVKEAYEIMERMPFVPDGSVWGAFLGACRVHKQPELCEVAITKLMELRPDIAGTYVTLSNLFAAAGKWGEFAETRKLMRGTGKKKETGISWVELHNQVYSFVAGDKVGSHIELIYEILEVLVCHMKDAGYVPDFDSLVHDLQDGT